MIERYFNVKFQQIEIIETDADIGINKSKEYSIEYDGVLSRKSGTKKFIQEQTNIESTHELQVLDDIVFKVNDLIEITNNPKYNGTYIITDLDINVGDVNDFQVINLMKQGSKDVR